MPSFFSDPRRRKWAPLLLLAAGVGAYAAVDSHLPREHQVVLLLGPGAKEVTSIELSWTKAGTSDDAALTTRWHFAPGSAPTRLPFVAKLAEGAWDVEAFVERVDRPETTRWPYRANLGGSAFWKRDTSGDAALVLPIRDALR